MIDHVAGGNMKQFAGSLTAGGKPPRAGSRRFIIDYRTGMLPLPEAVIARIHKVHGIRADYLRGASPYMTEDDERDARARGSEIVAASTGTAAGKISVGDIFKVAGVHAGVRQSLDELERLTPGGHVARSPLHEAWDRICRLEGIAEGEPRLKRLRRLVKQIDDLLPGEARPVGAALELYRLGILAAMLATLPASADG
ncbi:MAG: hypothetical protein ACHQWU_05490 [Gemmatimonadales bacterium]